MGKNDFQLRQIITLSTCCVFYTSKCTDTILEGESIAGALYVVIAIAIDAIVATVAIVAIANPVETLGQTFPGTIHRIQFTCVNRETDIKWNLTTMFCTFSDNFVVSFHRTK